MEIDSITKTYGEKIAVEGLSLTVPERTICGLIGPNGSGKTSVIRMLMGIIYPDAGSGFIRVLGDDRPGAASDAIGYLPEERGLYKRMRVADLLCFYAELKGCRDVREDVDRWLGRMQLANAANKRVDALSKGMAQKVQYIAAVINCPQLIILDEPFSGLDPVNTEVIRDSVLEQRRHGATVILSTHDMPVAEKMCDFIVMMFRGRKVLDGTMDSIQQSYGTDTIRVRVEEAGASLKTLPGVGRVTDYGRFQELQMEKDNDPQRILRRLVKQTRVFHFEVTRPSLHDIFVRIAGRGAAERADA